MPSKINSKLIIESDKSAKTPISNPVKTPTTSSQLTDGLSGVKLGSFGSVTNSTLAKSLKTSNTPKTEEVKTAAKVGEAPSIDETDVSLFTKETNGGAADVNDLDSTLSKLENDDACLATMENTVKSARGYLSTASKNIEKANAAVANEDWESALEFWQEAQACVEKARQEAQKAGDTSLNKEIQFQTDFCQKGIASVTSRIQDPIKSILNSGSVGSSCVGSGNSYSFASALGTGMQKGLNNGVENIGKNLFGGNKSNGSGSTNGAGKSNGTSSSGKSNRAGQSSSTKKSSGSNKSNGLQYDKNNKEIKAAVEKEAVPTYNNGSEMIAQANKDLPGAQTKLEEATREISCANIDMKELSDASREQMEKYSSAKQKVYDVQTKIAEQNKIQIEQDGISKECQNQINTLSSQEETKKGSVKSAEIDYDNAEKGLKDANAGVTNAKTELTQAESLPASDPNRETIVRAAEAKLKAAETKQEKANIDLINAKNTLAKERAELKEIQENLEMYREKQKEASEKGTKAGDKIQKLRQEEEKAFKEFNEINDVVNQLGEKEKALKERLDKAYENKTNAKNKISECEQKIEAGETYQDMGEELRDNAIQKIEDSKDTEESKWYNPFSWF